MRDLPQHISAGNILGSQLSKIEQNLYKPPEPRSYIELQAGGGYFSKFTWQEDSYLNFIEEQKKDRQEKKNKQLNVHGDAPFITMPKNQISHKHISPFQSALYGPGDGVAIGFLSEDDPYEANAFEVLRAKWISDSKMLYGDFKYSQHNSSLSKVSRGLLPDMVGFIKRNLLADWSDINFIIGTNPEDYIEIRFDALSLDTPIGLNAYMKTLINSNDIVLKY